MTDSHSEEEEIIKKRRFTQPHTKKNDLKSLFDEEESEEMAEEPQVNDFEQSTVFYEIFGTGKEYLYVLEDQKISEEEDLSNEEPLENNKLSPEDCKRYIVWNTDIINKHLERFVDLLLKGYSLNYILLHDINYELDIYTAMKVEELVKHYKRFIKARSGYKSGYEDEIYSYDALKYISKYEEHKRKYKPYGTNKFFLTVEQFETNLKDRESVFVPCCYTPEGDLNNFDEEEYIFQLGTSLTIKDFIVQMYKIHGSVDRQALYKFFLSTDVDDLYNERRKEILDKVIDSVKVNEDEIKEGLSIENQKVVIFNTIFDRIFNGSLRRLDDTERIVSCTKENNMIKGVVINNRGEVTDKFNLTKQDLESYLDQINPVCILLSGFSPGIRLIMQSLISRSCFYVDNIWYKDLNINKYDFCTRIGRLALCPEFEYIRLFKEGFRKDQIAQVCGFGEDNELKPTTNDVYGIIKSAILASMSINGLDLNLILSQPDKIDILTFIGVKSITKVLGIENYSELSELEQKCVTKVEFTNVLTYLRLFKEYSNVKNPLDSTNVHVENYFVINELVGEFKEGDELENKLKENFDKIEELSLAYSKGIRRDDDIAGLRITKRDIKRIVDCVGNVHRPEFCGFPDRIAFQNLSGSTLAIVGSVLEGRVFFVGEGYVLVAVLNNVTVFCLTNDSYFINQMVKVKINEANEAFVSFNGLIVIEEVRKIAYPRFCKHPLFKELDSKQSEDYLIDNNELILLRRSTKDNSPVIVFQFYPSIYVHYKLEYDGVFSFRNKQFESIDNVVSNLIKPVLRNVQEISKHKHFYNSKEEAESHISGNADYIKYGFYFSKEYPGRLCFIFNNHGNIVEEFIGLYENLLYKGTSFSSVNDFLMYRKRL